MTNASDVSTAGPTIRDLFLQSADAIRPLLASTEVAVRWTTSSALQGLTTGALAGHLMRAVTSVDAYLDKAPPTGGEALDAAGYFLSIKGIEGDDLETELHTAIRRRADEEALAGHAGVVDRWNSTIDRLRDRLTDLSGDEVIQALGGRPVSFDEYLITRLVEMVVHADDLALSVGAERPRFDSAAEEAVIECLVEVARRRHGRAAVITALTRRERDTVSALRVL